MRKIWFDTDIGNDIDDSVALAYLLKKPECDLLGVSTVSGRTVERAKLADALCRVAGRKIPIYPGAEEPLLTPQRQAFPHQVKYLADFEHSEAFETGRAIEAMYGAIAKNPGEVALLATGPMTNVALLLKAHPDVPALLKEIVVMCGEFFGKSRYHRVETEWNAFCDPYAAAILYATKGVKIRSVGLDVTSQLTMDREEVKARYTSPLLRAVYDFSGCESGERMSITYHDPLAAVSLFRSEVMTYRAGEVSVELHGERVMGRTYFEASEGGNDEVAEAVDAEAFYGEYFGIANR